MNPNKTTRAGAIMLCDEMAQHEGPATSLPPTDAYATEVRDLANIAHAEACGNRKPSAQTWEDAARLLRGGWPGKRPRWAIITHGDYTSILEDPDKAAEVLVLNLPADKLPHGARLQLQAIGPDGVTRVGAVLGYEVRREGLGGFTVGVVRLPL
jgi:hypothetical protein